MCLKFNNRATSYPKEFFSFLRKLKKKIQDTYIF